MSDVACSSLFQMIGAVSGLGGVVVALVALLRHDPARAAQVTELVERTSRAVRDVNELRKASTGLNAVVAFIGKQVSDPSSSPWAILDGSWAMLEDAAMPFRSAQAPLSLMELHPDAAVADCAKRVLDHATHVHLRASVLSRPSTQSTAPELAEFRARFTKWDISELHSALDQLQEALLAVLADPSASLPRRGRARRAAQRAWGRLVGSSPDLGERSSL